jgi:hypothetical protein
VVSADDFIFPECLVQMVELGEANPSVGIITSYQLSGDHILWQGFKYPRAVLSGTEMCRRIFLGGDKTFGFGSPTSIMYRADLVRSSEAFYPNSSPHADTSACFQHLRNCSLGFVYQVLSYERTHEATQSSKSKEMNRYSSAYLNDLILYGPSYLNKEEFERLVNNQLKDYHRFLALLKAAVIAVLQETLNPKQAVGKLWKRISPPSPVSTVRSTQPGSSGYEIASTDLKNSEPLGAAREVPK